MADQLTLKKLAADVKELHKRLNARNVLAGKLEESVVCLGSDLRAAHRRVNCGYAGSGHRWRDQRTHVASQNGEGLPYAWAAYRQCEKCELTAWRNFRNTRKGRKAMRKFLRGE